MTDPQQDPAERRQATPRFDRHMLAALICPKTGGRLEYDATRQELISKSGHIAYPIRDGIPVMLIDEARALDD